MLSLLLVAPLTAGWCSLCAQPQPSLRWNAGSCFVLFDCAVSLYCCVVLMFCEPVACVFLPDFLLFYCNALVVSEFLDGFGILGAGVLLWPLGVLEFWCSLFYNLNFCWLLLGFLDGFGLLGAGVLQFMNIFYIDCWIVGFGYKLQITTSFVWYFGCSIFHLIGYNLLPPLVLCFSTSLDLFGSFSLVPSLCSVNICGLVGLWLCLVPSLWIWLSLPGWLCSASALLLLAGSL